MPTVTASFNRPADTVPYAAGDLICNAGTPVALEYATPLVSVPAGGGSAATITQSAAFRSARLIRASGASPAAIRAVFLTRNPAQPSQWPAFTGGDNALFPTVPFCANLDFDRTIPAPRITFTEPFVMDVQGLYGASPVRILLMAMEAFKPLSGETFTLELSTDRTA